MHEDPRVSALGYSGGERSWAAQKSSGQSWVYALGLSV